MSRTFRRTQQYVARCNLLTRSEEVKDPWFVMYRYPTLTFDQAYDRQKARFHRDHNSGKFGVPRNFRRRLGSKQLRLKAAHGLHVGLRLDEWDGHVCEHRARNAKRYWF